MDVIAVFTTVGHLADAHKIAHALVQRKLVACAQISQIESIYRWQGEIQTEGEFRLLLKTTAERYTAVEAAIRELHPYELPAIHATPLQRVYPPYAQWVHDTAGDAQ